MIVRGVGKWNQDAGQSENGEFGQTGRAGARNSEIGRAVHFLHPVVKGGDKGRDIFAPIVIGNQALIARTGQMDDLKRDALQ